MANIGWIGLGIMGSRQAANLRRAGHELTVYNRTRATAEAWAQEHGATVADTPAAVAAASEVVFSMVVDGAQVKDVLLGDDGAIHGARAGALFVDMTTIAPGDSREIAAALEPHGVAFCDAPVTGSAPRAQDGTLTIMVGGAPADVQRARPLLEAMGALIVETGPVGTGEAIKLINNAVGVSNLATLAQALIVADAEDLDLDALVAVMGAGAGGSTMLTLKATPLREHDYTTLFKTEHMLKDVRLCLEEAQAAGVPFPAAASARDALIAACGRGHGDDDFTAVLEAFEGLAGRRLAAPSA
jgi:3-hydroxyisobutyrate dehydrogenase-like beta-hydroxyacid dehydrogenase